MSEQIPNRIRLAISALPIAGLLGVILILPPGVFINPLTDPEAFARSTDSIALGNLIGIGAWALYTVLAGGSASRLPVYGLLLTFAGVGLQLPFAGIFAFAAPVAGRLYLAGDTNMVRVISDATSISNPSRFCSVPRPPGSMLSVQFSLVSQYGVAMACQNGQGSSTP